MSETESDGTEIEPEDCWFTSPSVYFDPNDLPHACIMVQPKHRFFENGDKIDSWEFNFDKLWLRVLSLLKDFFGSSEREHVRIIEFLNNLTNEIKEKKVGEERRVCPYFLIGVKTIKNIESNNYGKNDLIISFSDGNHLINTFRG